MVTAHVAGQSYFILKRFSRLTGRRANHLPSCLTSSGIVEPSIDVRQFQCLRLVECRACFVVALRLIFNPK
jgi:hypothetical protein